MTSTRLYYDKLSRKRFQLALKRGIDIALSLILILALSPVMAFCAALVKADGGSILYRQVRIGRYSRPFVIYKFRTMTERAYLGGELTRGRTPASPRPGASSGAPVWMSCPNCSTC